MLSPYIYPLCKWERKDEAATVFISLGLSNDLVKVKAYFWGHAQFHKASKALMFLAKMYIDTDPTLIPWVFHSDSCSPRTSELLCRNHSSCCV